MFLEICALLALIIFAVLAFYLIATLISLKKTLLLLDVIATDLASKMKRMESSVDSLNNLGEICADKTARLRADYFAQERPRPATQEVGEEVAFLVLVGLKLAAKLLKGK